MDVYAIAVGDEVYWHDPDEGKSSGYYNVTAIMTDTGKVEDPDTMVILNNQAGTTAEVFVSELG